MKRKFAILIAFLLVALLALALVACNFNDGNKPSGNVDDINNNDDTTTKDIVLRDDMTLEELKEVIKDVKSATVKAYGEDNQLIWEEYCKENVVISYNYGIEYPYSFVRDDMLPFGRPKITPSSFFLASASFVL